MCDYGHFQELKPNTTFFFQTFSMSTYLDMNTNQIASWCQKAKAEKYVFVMRLKRMEGTNCTKPEVIYQYA